MSYYGLQVLQMMHKHKPPSLDQNWKQDTHAPFPTVIDTGATLIDKSNVDSFLSTPPK